MATVPSLTLIPSGYKTSNIYSVTPSNGVGDFDFTRGTIATRVNKNNLVETVAANLPRLDYTNSTCPNLLLEPQSTNKCKFSEYFGFAPVSGAWTSVGLASPTGSFSTAPNGANTSTKITRTDLASTSRLEASVLMTGGYATETNTASIYVKNIDSTHFLFRMEMLAYSSSYVDASFNFSTKELILESSSTYVLKGLKVDELANGWFRLSVTYQNSGYNQDRFQIAPSNSANRNAVTANTSVEIWGGQFELLDYASSYVATSNSNVTRFTEIANNAGDNTVFNSSEGVLFAEISALGDDALVKSIAITDGTVNNIIVIRFNTYGGNSAIDGIYVNSGTLTTTAILYPNTTDFTKIALSYKQGFLKLYVNGTLEQTQNLNVNNAINWNTLQFNIGNGTQSFYGKLKDLRVYKNALTDVELVELTSY